MRDRTLPAIIEAEGIHTSYGTTRVLHGIDLTVHSGEAVGLMGRNGMGKTTLIRSILGLTPAEQGNLAIKGVAGTIRSPHLIARQGIAYVPEGRGIFSKLTVREHLVMATRPGPTGLKYWSIDRIFGLFPRLRERAGQKAASLSGGEQQMLAIGRALVTNPDLLILDEATEGLAPLVAKEIWSIIRLIRNDGIAAILVDKDFSAVSSVTTRNIILVKGRVAFEGSSEELRNSNELVRNLLGV